MCTRASVPCGHMDDAVSVGRRWSVDVGIMVWVDDVGVGMWLVLAWSGAV